MGWLLGSAQVVNVHVDLVLLVELLRLLAEAVGVDLAAEAVPLAEGVLGTGFYFNA